MKEELVCGGSTTTYIKDAPQVIKSDKMVYFSVSTKLHNVEDSDGNNVGFIHAFAVLTSKNESFVYLVKNEGYGRRDNTFEDYALIKENIFPELVEIVNKHNLVKNNGRVHRTQGLPENFGGTVEIEYESGEKIYIEDNQSPFISSDTGEDIIKSFEKFLKAKHVVSQDINTLKSIRFREDRKDGGFTDILLELESDGTGKIKKQQRFDNPKIYESEKTADAGKIEKIKNSIEKSGLLLWCDVPVKDSLFSKEKQLSFIFENGEEITIKDDKRIPYALGNGFFDIELAMMY